MKTAWEVLGVDKPEITLIRKAYKEKMRSILNGTSQMDISVLNSAYNEVKTLEKLKAYEAKFPFKISNPEAVVSSQPKSKRKMFGDVEEDNYYPGWAGPVRKGDRQKEAPKKSDGSIKFTENDQKDSKDFDIFGRWKKGVFR